MGDLYIMFYEACVKGSNVHLREKDRIVGILLYWIPVVQLEMAICLHSFVRHAACSFWQSKYCLHSTRRSSNVPSLSTSYSKPTRYGHSLRHRAAATSRVKRCTGQRLSTYSFTYNR